MEARILIVDDNEQIADLTLRGIKQKRPAWRPLTAHNCGQARECYNKELPDAAVLDVMLPDGNGFELLMELRELEPRIPIVIVTGSALEDVATVAITGQAYVMLRKPFSFDRLVDALENELHAASLVRQEGPINDGGERKQNHWTGKTAIVRMAEVYTPGPLAQNHGKKESDFF